MTKNQLPPVLRRWRFIAVAMGVTALAGGGVLLAANSDPATALAFHSLPSTRVLDIRAASQVGAFSTPLGAASTLDFVVPGLPDDAKSVSLNVTVTDGTYPSFLVVYPTGDTRPGTSTVNWNSVNAVANTATVNVAADHSLRVYNDMGSVNVIIDLLGYYAPSPVATAAAGTNADTVVSSLAGPWRATNPSVSLTTDGVEFGPYADGGAAGGSVWYDGLNGQPLSAVTSFSYYMRYVSSLDTGGVGVPYLRIYTNADANDAIFSPNTQSPDSDVAEGPFHEWVATSGSWRYDDDPGNGPDIPFADLITAHGTDVISGIYISTGFTTGTNLAALLRWVEINGQRFAFQS